MLESETLILRSEILQKLRAFFIERGYIELDTPAMSPALIPDTTHEVFQAAYIDPWTDEEKTVFLSASHEYFLKKAVAATKSPLFQLSKCYKNCESTGRLNSPEFTLLEAYTPGTSSQDSSTLTEELLSTLLPAQFPVIRLSTDEAFSRYAGFSLSENAAPEQLAEKIRELGIPEFPDNPFDEWSSGELYELLMPQCIEPALPKDACVFITDIPAFVPYMARTKTDGCNFWKDCWTVYIKGIKIAVSRNEETDCKHVKAFLEKEGRIKNACARIPCTIDADFYKSFESFPECTSIELDVDRLVMLIAGKNSIESVIPFPFRLKTGYY